MSEAVRVLPDPEAAAEAVVARLVQLAEEAVQRTGVFVLAVSGGRTPEPMFRGLAALEDGSRRWPSWQLYWCDERSVPPGDPQSNAGLAQRLWLTPARFPAANVHPVETGVPPDEAARRYEQQLRARPARVGTGLFDAIVLGIGPDGHTASLFPGAPALGATDRWVAAEPHPSQPPFVPRVTLTLPGIGESRCALFLVCGADKRPALSRILARSREGPSPDDLPASRVRARETVEWYLDRAAAPAHA